MDGLKGGAILIVVLYHIYWILGDYLSRAAFDQVLQRPEMPLLFNLNGLIEVFFLVAGFLNAAQLLNLYDRGSFRPGGYVLQRLARFLPVLIVALLFYAAAGLPNLSSCWSNLLLVNNYFAASRRCMEWSWYLSVQEQYMILGAPVVVWLLARFPRVAWWLLALAGSLLVLVVRLLAIQKAGLSLPVPFHSVLDPDGFTSFFANLYVRTETRGLPLLVGSILGWAYVRTTFFERLGRIRLWIALPLALVAVGLILPGFLQVSPHHGNWDTNAAQWNLATTRHVTTAFFALILVFLVADNALVRPLRALLSARFWYPVSQLTLWIYLVHPTVIFLIYRAVDPGMAGRLALAVYFLAALAFSIGLSVVGYLFVERPVTDRVRRLTGAARSPLEQRA